MYIYYSCKPKSPMTPAPNLYFNYSVSAKLTVLNLSLATHDIYLSAKIMKKENFCSKDYLQV